MAKTAIAQTAAGLVTCVDHAMCLAVAVGHIMCVATRAAGTDMTLIEDAIMCTVTHDNGGGERAWI